MRDILVGLFVSAAALWVLAVLFGIAAGPLGLTQRDSGLGRIARFCKAIFDLSP
jgi:hypothetical protein